METVTARCQPGDITITPVPEGLMVGRAMPQVAGSPSWQCIKVVTYYEDAIELARELAAESSARAWFQKNTDQYDRIR